MHCLQPLVSWATLIDPPRHAWCHRGNTAAPYRLRHRPLGVPWRKAPHAVHFVAVASECTMLTFWGIDRSMPSSRFRSHAYSCCDGVIAEGANADAAVAVDRLQRHLLHGLVGKLGPLFTLRQARAEQVTPHWLVVLGPQGLDEFIVGNRALKVLFGLVHVCSIQSSAFSFSTEK
jgi:hypothetical protein